MELRLLDSNIAIIFAVIDANNVVCNETITDANVAGAFRINSYLIIVNLQIIKVYCAAWRVAMRIY